ncbi:hypothetical protein DFS34DRAFT_295598 [Phlyctochytrium arcticum]|nr:hypothetical protein DFS34DRAFT_295598 [Phlyctochytrium arcticum]
MFRIFRCKKIIWYSLCFGRTVECSTASTPHSIQPHTCIGKSSPSFNSSKFHSQPIGDVCTDPLDFPTLRFFLLLPVSSFAFMHLHAFFFALSKASNVPPTDPYRLISHIFSS